MAGKPKKPTKAAESKAAKTKKAASPEVVDDPRRAFFDRWLDAERWPAVFGGRWPDWPGMGDQLRVEEFVEDDSLVIRVEIPGVNADEDIEVEVDRGRLRIRAQREQREETKDDTSFRSEFHYGSFQRTIELPPGTDADDVTASYDDGILEVRAPHGGAAAERTRIDITSGG